MRRKRARRIFLLAGISSIAALLLTITNSPWVRSARAQGDAAATLHRDALVFDGHVHTINRVYWEGIDPWKPQTTGLHDYARAKQAGVDGVIEQLYIQDAYSDYNLAVKQAVRLIETFYQSTFGYTESAANNQFDRADDWARSTDFQRHTLRVHAMYQLPWDMNVSGLYMFGSGNYSSTIHASSPYGKLGQNRLNLGPAVVIPAAIRDRFEGPEVIATGAVLPRNALRGTPLHKVDVRLTKNLKLGGHMTASLIAEAFNLFNHANYGSFVNQVNSATFGNPTQSIGNAYVPRSGQLGFRVAF